jgi:hypothetical protein
MAAIFLLGSLPPGCLDAMSTKVAPDLRSIPCRPGIKTRKRNVSAYPVSCINGHGKSLNWIRELGINAKLPELDSDLAAAHGAA